MKKREATKAKNRALLLDAGRRIFASKGFAGARITDITDEAGLAAGTFYKYFHDKRDLFAVIVEELTPNFRKSLRQSRRFDSSEAPENWVRRGFASFFDIAETYPEIVRLFLVQDGNAEEEFGRMLVETRRRYQDDLVADMRQWISAGAIPPVEAELISQLVMSMAVSMAAVFLEDPKNLRNPVLNALTNMVVGGIKETILHPGRGASHATAASSTAGG